MIVVVEGGLRVRVESELTTYISRSRTYTWFLEFCQLSEKCWNIVDGRTLTLNVERRTRRSNPLKVAKSRALATLSI